MTVERCMVKGRKYSIGYCRQDLSEFHTVGPFTKNFRGKGKGNPVTGSGGPIG